MKNLCIFNARLVDAYKDTQGCLFVSGERIKSIVTGNFSSGEIKKIAQSIFSKEEETEFVDAKGLIIQPSFVDLHAHFRCPGQEQKEEIATAVKAAAAGGFGTLVLMPNTTPPVSSMEEAAAVCEQAQQYSMAQVIQSVSITHHFDGKTLSHLDTLPDYTASLISAESPQSSRDSLYTLPGIPLVTEDGRDVESAAVLFRAMELCGKKGIAVACHCEDMSLATEARQFRSRARAILYEGAKGDPNSFLKNLPEEKKREAFALLEEANRILRMAEDIATKRNIDVAHQADCHLHVCHISTEGSLEALRQAKEKGYKVTCEATPHHIGFGLTTSDENLVHIVNPPLRLAKDQAALFGALKDGTVDCISTDHAPHTAQDKINGAPGFSGLETAYALCNTVLIKQGILSYKEYAKLASANPAGILKLNKGPYARGLLEPGFLADFILCDPDFSWTVRGENFYSKGKYTPLEGKTLTGKVMATYFRGRCVYKFDEK